MHGRGKVQDKPSWVNQGYTIMHTMKKPGYTNHRNEITTAKIRKLAVQRTALPTMKEVISSFNYDLKF